MDTRRDCVGLGQRHGRCARTVTGELGESCLDDVSTLAVIRPGHESSVGSTQLIRRWGLLMGVVVIYCHLSKLSVGQTPRLQSPE